MGTATFKVMSPISPDNPVILRHDLICYICGSCKRTCSMNMTVLGHYDESEGIKCIYCGQCVRNCVGFAMDEVGCYDDVNAAIVDKTKTVVAFVSPAVRASIGEAFGMSSDKPVMGKIVTLLRNMGFDYVLDTASAADLTVIEEAHELLNKMERADNTPLFTSCCPSWVRFAELFYPNVCKYISSCKSPIAMMGAAVKLWFEKHKGISPEDLVTVAITPCTSKKYEITLPDMSSSGARDVDFVMTARELVNISKENCVRLSKLEDDIPDSIFGEPSADGVHFGFSGGVAMAVINTVYNILTGKNEAAPIEIRDLPDKLGEKITADIDGKKLNCAVIWGTGNVRRFLDTQDANEYQLIEIMACPGGCISGGGQPKDYSIKGCNPAPGRKKTLENYSVKQRFSYQNPYLADIYSEFFTAPGAENAVKYLHRHENKEG